MLPPSPSRSRISDGAGMRDAVGTARSSRASQRIEASARSLFAMYGRKELLAKSLSPMTMARNGRASAAGSVPSMAAARTRAPGGAPAAS